MFIKKIGSRFGILLMALTYSACSLPNLVQKTQNQTVPVSFNGAQDTVNVGKVKWKDYFTDPHLDSLINLALANNQELNITLQEIDIAKSEARARKGEYLPFVTFNAGTGVEKVGRFTSKGANDATTDIKPGIETPEPLPDFMVGAYANWEIDIWKKLRNAKKAAVYRYLASIEGRNFMVTNVIAEIANSYYELMALDNQLEIVNQTIAIQQNALSIVRNQKEAARVTELAVRKFEAEVLHTQSLQYDIQQKITETSNRINFLVGRFPQPVHRTAVALNDLTPAVLKAGLPAQLLENRPDIKQAEQQLQAAKLDVKVAKANFYPSLGIRAGVGFQAYNPSVFLQTPESLLYSLIGDLSAPLINRNAIKAAYIGANAQQIQAVYNYEKTVLNATIEVANQLSNIRNLEKSYDLQSRQVQALTQSIDISNELFKFARADYMEVLLTQRDALESKFELVETRMKQMNAKVNIYRALGGGWR